MIGLKHVASLSQPIRSKTKTNRDLLACVFPSAALRSDCSIGLSASVAIGFGFTTLECKPLQDLF